MKHLIIKDFRVLKLMNLITIVICLMGGYIGISYDNILKTKIVYIFVVLLTSYLSSLLLSQQEIKTKSDIMINSLPIDRSLIVKSKYLFILIYVSLSSLIVFFSSNILGVIFPTNTPGIHANIFDVILTVGLALIFYSIYLLLYYFNIGKAQIFNQIFYITLVLSPSILSRFSERIFASDLFKYLIDLNFNSIISLLMIIGIVLYIVSLPISIRIYQSKEL